MRFPVSALFLFASAAYVSAHLGTLQSPQSGASLTGGTTVAVKWNVSITHSSIMVELSTDDKTWTNVSGALGKTATTYNWKVPMTPTTHARIRICQVSSPGDKCSDADSV